MAGSTPYFGLSYFTFRDRLDTGINVQKEIDRFLLIDKQFFGLYAVFGNGVIDGWDVFSRDVEVGQTISVTVSNGIGIIESIASETVAPFIVPDLPPNERVGIYAVLTGGTLSTRLVDFIWSRTPLGDHAVLLANVTTASSGVASIDLSVKQEISFLEIIKDEIAKHKHRGTPSKIDLQQEVRNQLPGARVEDFDAAKITSGRFSPKRIPLLDHNELENNGLLAHAALDSFVRSLSEGNRQLLGEVASVNLLKHVIFLKYLYPKSDEELGNTILLIPGVSPDRFIDFDASTSYIDLVSQCISGVPVKQGQITSIIWETTSAFLSASDRQNVSVANDRVVLARGGGSSRNVENFEDVPKSDVHVPGFSEATEVIVDNLTVVSDNSDTTHSEGFYSGKFTTDREFRALYTRTITQNNDWSLYDELVVDIKSLSLVHGAVYAYFINGEGDSAKKSPDFLLLGEDEITTNPDPEANGFERRSFSIAAADRNNVTKLVIYTDDIKTEHVFWVDNIFIRNQSLYPESGFIRFRYSGGAVVLFKTINYEADVPEGTEIRVRVRTANSPALLSRASFTGLLNPGDVFSQEGTDAEIDVVLVSNESRNKTPTLRLLELQIVVAASDQGFLITNADEWDRGTYINSERTDEAASFSSAISIKKPVAVGNLYFSYLNSVNEIDPSRIAQFGVSGSSFLLSPKQAVNYAATQGQKGFSNAFSVYRLIDKNYIIADTDNDRIIETTPEGKFVRGIGSHNITTESFFYPLTAVYNQRTGVLSSLFSKSIDIKDLDITKVRLWIGGVSIDLSSDDTPSQPSHKTKRIVEILLSVDKAEQLTDTKSDVFVQYLAGAWPIPFEATDSTRQLLSSRGTQVFLGDFVYVDGINHPIFANKLENGDWVIGNSSIPFEIKNQTGEKTSTTKQVSIGGTIQFIVEVDKPADGVTIAWEQTAPIQIQSTITFTSVDNIGTVTISPTTESQIGEWTLTYTARYVGPAGPISSTQTSIRLIIAAQSLAGGEEKAGASPSIVQYDMTSEKEVFSYEGIKFSDYSLGSVYEIDSNFFLVAGVVSTDDFLPSDGSGSSNPPADETFEEEAARVMEKFRGKIVIIDRTSKAVIDQYDSPDRSYVSDAVVDDNGYYVVAETSFSSNGGRVIKMDGFFNILWQIGGGMFSKINDVRSQHSNNIVVST